MSTNLAAVRFEDGLILYTHYQDTADVLGSNLYSIYEEWNKAEPTRKCNCSSIESAEAATWDMYWKVTACRNCKVIITGQAPYGLEGWGGYTLVKPVPIIYKEAGWWKQLIESLK